MLDVYLLKQGAPKAVRLSLPAADCALLDALDKAGIINERDIYSVEVYPRHCKFVCAEHPRRTACRHEPVGAGLL